MKKVAVLNDLSGFGKCSLGVAIPVLSVMGVQCCSIPTAVLTNQTGYSHFYYQDLSDMISMYTKAWTENGESFDGIYSGYTTGPRQIDLFMDFIDVFYKDDTKLFVDPVMGDDGHTYKMYTPQLREKMINLVRRADVITPNLTEACILAGIDIGKVTECNTEKELSSLALDAAKVILSKACKEQEIVITGLKCMGPKENVIAGFMCPENKTPMITNMVISPKETYSYSTPFINRGFSGTGDLTASIICGGAMNGLSTKESLKKAADFVYKCILDTVAEDIPGREGVNFEKYLYTLA